MELGLLIWRVDGDTAKAATAYPVRINRAVPASQATGHPFNPADWNRRILQPAVWATEAVRSSPAEIVRQFRTRRYTQALALVVSWGEMWRQPDAIWGWRKLEMIERTLDYCAQSILSSKSIEESWKRLTGKANSEIGWTAVLSSKTLHFLCRALGFERNPPVPLDGGVIRQKVWPMFRDGIPLPLRPKSWNDDTFEAYSRYMTAINVWANQKDWTTTETEVTIFDQFGGS